MFFNFFAAIEKATPPTSLGARVSEESLPDVADLPAPWAAWTLIGLVRHYKRQQWVHHVVRTQLQGEPELLATAGAFGHPEGIPRCGVVPGLIDWTYCFHGCGCCLTHRTTGEQIDVDFFDTTADYIREWFYFQYIASLKAPAGPETRLLELHSSTDTMRVAIEDLRQSGLLVLHERDRAFKLSDAVMSHIEAIGVFCSIWEAEEDRRLSLSVGIGDWLAAQDALDTIDDRPLRIRIKRNAEHCRNQRRVHLCRLFDSSECQQEAILALGDIGLPDLSKYLKRALATAPSGTASSALEVIRKSDDPRWCEPIYQTWRLFNPNGNLPAPSNWIECAEFLLRHDYLASDIVKELPSVESHVLADAALLAMEYSPQLALSLLGLALRSSIPVNRMNAAALLVIVDRPWSRTLLTDALAETDDYAATSECRAALLSSHDPQASEAVRKWKERNPFGPNEESGTSTDELVLRHDVELLQLTIRKYHDRVMHVRDQLPF